MQTPSIVLPPSPDLRLPHFQLPSATIRLVSSLGNKVLFDHVQPAHSYTRNFYNYLLLSAFGISTSDATFGSGHANFKDTGGSVRNFTYSTYAWYVINTAADATCGIIVGRGSTAESFDSYALATPCAHGTGSNQLSYRAMSMPTPSWTSGTKTFDLAVKRLFDNASGSTVTITETGIYASAYPGSYKFMFCRDLLASSIDVLNSGILTVTYTQSLVFPE